MVFLQNQAGRKSSFCQSLGFIMCFETTLESFQKRESYSALVPKPTPKNTETSVLNGFFVHHCPNWKPHQLIMNLEKVLKSYNGEELLFPWRTFCAQCPVEDGILLSHQERRGRWQKRKGWRESLNLFIIKKKSTSLFLAQCSVQGNVNTTATISFHGRFLLLSY